MDIWWIRRNEVKNVKQYVLDYIEGRVRSQDFLNALWNDPVIFEWLQSIIPVHMSEYYKTIAFPDGSGIQHIAICDVKTKIEGYWKGFGMKLGKELNIHDTITRLFQQAFPNEKLTVDETLEKQYDFILDSCPEYIGGPDVEKTEILEKLMSQLPIEMGRTERVRVFKAQLKQEFHIEGQKYPRWLQEAEWPFSNGKPMRFLYQKNKNQEVKQYFFEDVDTKELRIIEQFT